LCIINIFSQKFVLDQISLRNKW